MILYLGNILSSGGGSVGFIETLTPRLANRYELIAVSAVKSRILRLVHMLMTVWRYRRRCRVVLIDTFSTQAFWFAVADGRLCRAIQIPYVCIIRGGNFPHRMKQSPGMVKQLLSGAARVVVPSRYLGEALEREGVQVTCIPNFINLDLYVFKKREVLKPSLLWVRAFDAIYNPIMAVEVLYIVRKAVPEATLNMVGADKGGLLSKVKDRIAELGLQECVEISGRLSKEEWTRRSAEFDLFINTTHVDNMPVSVVEALALGLPVVTTNVGGVPFLVSHENTALLVGDGDAPAMAAEIIRLLDSPKLAGQLSEKGRKLAESFSWDRVGPVWHSVLDPFESR